MMELIELARVVAARQEKPKEKTEKKPKKDTPEPKEAAKPSVVSTVNYSATIVKQTGNHELIIS